MIWVMKKMVKGVFDLSGLKTQKRNRYEVRDGEDSEAECLQH